MSQGDIVKIIPAGFENFEVRAGGDFVFIKECARDVVVTIDDSPIIMARGDKRRVDRKNPSEQAFTTFQISNKYDFDLRVVMVVGDGDYNSQIVTGELSIREGIKTTFLSTENLPVLIKKHVGIDEPFGSSDVKSTELGTFSDFDAGSVIVKVKNELYIFDESLSAIKVLDLELAELRVVNVALPNFGSVSGFRGGYYSKNDGFIYLHSYNKIFRYSIVNNVFDEVFELEGGLAFFLGAFIRDGVYYLPIQGVGSVSGIDYGSGVFMLSVNNSDQVTSIGSIDTDYNAFFSLSYDENQDSIITSNVSRSSSRKYEFLEFNKLSNYESFNELWTGGGVIYDYNNNAVFGIKKGTDKPLYKWVLDNKEYSAKMFFWDGENESTKKTFYVNEGDDIAVLPISGGVVLRGEIAKILMRGMRDLSEAVGKISSYKDYIISLNYSDGINQFKKSAGTATWAYRGLKDNGELLLPSTVELEVMPEFLTDVY